MPITKNLSVVSKLIINQVVMVCGLVILLFISATSLLQIREKAEYTKNRSVHYALMAKNIQIDVIQVQEWLTDISATRGLPGYDDGFKEAETYAVDARQKLNEFRQMFLETHDATGDAAVTDILSAFETYYNVGQNMAKAYIAEGPEAGNHYMDTFDKYAEEITEKVDTFVTYQVEDLNINMNLIVRRVGINIIIFSIGSIFLIIFIIILAVFLIRHIQRSLASLLSVVGSLGNSDFSSKVEIRNHDEFGMIGISLNKAIEAIRGLLISVQEQVSRTSTIGSDLMEGMHQTSTAVSDINATIHDVQKRTDTQGASVTETTVVMEQIILNIEHLNELIEDQSANVTESSSAIEETMASISSVTQTLIRNVENINNLAASSDSGKQGLMQVAADIQEVAHDSEGLLEISQVIQDIASQTDLLSMNAAIEAAHAGESGKGFSVVADEIRKLAESSGAQAQTVAEVLNKIKVSIEMITKSTETVLDKFSSIETEVAIVTEQENIIRNAMEEQTIGSKQVLEAINQLNDITERVQASSEEMLTNSKQVVESSTVLSRLTEEITTNMNTMAERTAHINQAVTEAANLSNDNKNNIDTLVREIKKFTL